MNSISYNIHPTESRGAAQVPNRAVTLGSVQTNAQGQGHLDVFVSGQEDRLRQAFERPVEVRSPDGTLLKTYQPYTREALNYLVQQGGLKQQGLAAEAQPQPRS